MFAAQALLAGGITPTPYAGSEAGTYLHYTMDTLNGTWDPTETVALLDNSGHNRHSSSSVRRSRMSDLNGALFGKAVLARVGPTTPATAMADLDFTGDFTFEMWYNMPDQSGMATSGRFLTSRVPTIGWIMEVRQVSGYTYKLWAHEGSAWADKGVQFTITPGWSHWAMSFKSRGGGDTSDYDVTFYLTHTNATALTTVGTFRLNPGATAATLKTLSFGWTFDPAGSSQSLPNNSDTHMLDGCRISTGALTSFDTLGLAAEANKGTVIYFQ
jgi:hypothetical protein